MINYHSELNTVWSRAIGIGCLTRNKELSAIVLWKVTLKPTAPSSGTWEITVEIASL